ncbi:hypothetical protein [Kitasatospora aureofaciens]
MLADLVETTSLSLGVIPARSPLLGSQVLLDLDGVLMRTQAPASSPTAQALRATSTIAATEPTR